MSRRLVLVGGGHAHLLVIEGVARGRASGAEVLLVSEHPRQLYSGMVSGLVGGRYREDDIVIDLAALAARAGVGFVPGRAARLDPDRREVVLEGGERIGFDVASLAVGASVAGEALPGVREHAFRIKPISGAASLIPALERAAALRPAGKPEPAGPGAVSVVVVGGGAAGVELALAARARLRRLGAGARITLLEAGARILGERPGAARQAELALRRNRVAVRVRAAVEEVEPDAVRLAGGGRIRSDVVIWAAGAAASPLFKASGLATDRSGFLLVDGSLRSVSHPCVYGAGDAVTLARYPQIPKSGVYAVRQGPVLLDNLAAALRGEPPPHPYRPRRRSLALLNTGDGRAILSYGGIALTSRWVMLLKDRIDRRWVRRFRSAG